LIFGRLDNIKIYPLNLSVRGSLARLLKTVGNMSDEIGYGLNNGIISVSGWWQEKTQSDGGICKCSGYCKSKRK